MLSVKNQKRAFMRAILEDWVVDTAISGNIVHALLWDGSVQHVDVSLPSEPRDLGVFEDGEHSVTAKLGTYSVLAPNDPICGGKIKSFILVPKEE